MTGKEGVRPLAGRLAELARTGGDVSYAAGQLKLRLHDEIDAYVVASAAPRGG